MTALIVIGAVLAVLHVVRVWDEERQRRRSCPLPACRGLQADGTCPMGYGRSCEGCES